MSPERPTPGTTVTIDATLHSRSDTPCDAIELGLIGREKRYRRTVTHGKTRIKTYHERVIIAEGSVAPEQVLTAGEHALSVQVELPREGLPPSYESELCSIRYELVARVEIPWWPDKEALQPFEMRAVKTTPSEPKPVRVVSHREPTGRELFVEVSLPRGEYSLADQVEGTLSLWNVAHHRLKAIEIDVVAVESPLVESSQGPVVTAQTSTVELDRKSVV